MQTFLLLDVYTDMIEGQHWLGGFVWQGDESRGGRNGAFAHSPPGSRVRRD